MHEDLDQFVAALAPEWQRVVCRQLLADIRASALFGEHLKWGNPYFEVEGRAVLKWYCAEQWINVYFFRGRELADPVGLFEKSENVKMMVLRVTADRRLDRQAFRELVQAAAERAHSESATENR